jgi:hypothetical protein
VVREGRQGVGDPQARATVLREAEGTSHQRARGPGVLDLAGDLVEVRLAVVAVEERLGVEEVDLARPSVREQADDGLGARRGVRRPRLEVARVPGALEVAPVEVRERRTVEPGGWSPAAARPKKPQSSSVGTIPAPKWFSRTRFTALRMSAAFSASSENVGPLASSFSRRKRPIGFRARAAPPVPP